MTEFLKRRVYFIDPAFQLNFIFKFCLIIVISFFLVGGAALMIARNYHPVAAAGVADSTQLAVDFIFHELAVILFIAAVVSLMIVLFLTLSASHKISGPIFRIRKDIERVQAGDLTARFFIRDSDQMQALAGSLEQMTQILRKRHLAIGGQCRSVTNFLEEKNLGGSKEDREKLLQMLKELYELLSYFKV